MATLKVIEGEPPVGYSFLTYDDTPMKPMLWYARAVKVSRVKNSPLGDYVMTHRTGDKGEKYILWIKKPKGKGKMVGVGFKK